MITEDLATLLLLQLLVCVNSQAITLPQNLMQWSWSGEKSMVQDAQVALSWLRREAGFEARLVVRLVKVED